MVKSFLFVLIGVLFGSFVTHSILERKDDQFTTIRPFNIFPRECIPANEKLQNVFYHLNALYPLVHKLNLLTLKISIEKQLSRGFFDRSNGKSKYVCKPKGLYETVQRSLADKPVHPTPDIYQLRLYAKLKDPSDTMLKGIAKAAFRKQPYYNKFTSKIRHDPRPIAMTILAQHGERAKSYAAQAYDNMDYRTLLGTSTAQVAAATNYADSLSKIETMMFKIMEEASNNSPLDFNQYDRFKQLAYALILSGDEGKNYTSAIEALMKRKVYAFGGWYGRLEVDPKHMCQVIDTINPKNTVIKQYKYCDK